MNSPAGHGDCHVFHSRLRALMAALGFLAGLLPGFARGASSEPLDLDITVTDSAGAPAAGIPLRIVLHSDENPRDPGAGRQLIADAQGRIQDELKVQVNRRNVSIYNFLNLPFFWNRVDTVEVGFECVGLGGLPVLYWLWFDYHTQSASRVSFAYAQDEQGRFVHELNFDWDSNRSGTGYSRAPQYSKAAGQPSGRPPAKLLYRDARLTREEQPDGSRRWKLEARLEMLPWSGEK